MACNPHRAASAALFLLFALGAPPAHGAPGERLQGSGLLPAPVFDAGDGIPGRAGMGGAAVTAAVFRSMAEFLPTRRIAPASSPSRLKEPSRPFEVRYAFEGRTHSLAEFLTRTDTTALLILKGEQIHFEGYFQGADRQDDFMSYSVGKSFVSTLVACAIQDGLIAGVEDPVVKYLPEVAGSAYGSASIREVLQMSSGTGYDEDYEDPHSACFLYSELLSRNQGGIYDFARSFKPVRKPGERFSYASTDTEILGALVARVAGRSLSKYLEDKLWKPMEAGAPARWLLDQPGSAGRELAGGGLQVQLRDYGRFGLLFANGGRVQGRQILPANWVEQATRPQAPQVQYGRLYPEYGLGYGYQWWCLPGPHGCFAAEGIHGQFILVDPVEQVVVVKLSSWAHAWEDAKEAETYAFFDAVAASFLPGGRP